MLTVIVTTALGWPAGLRAHLPAIPTVEARVVGPDGAPLESALVAVTFLGSHDRIAQSTGDVFSVDLVSAMTAVDGTCKLEGRTLDVDLMKVRMIGIQVKVNRDGFEPLVVDVANVRAAGAGVSSTFAVGLGEAVNNAPEGQGLFASLKQGIKDGWKAVKGTRFDRAYQDLFAKPLALTPLPPRDAQRQTNFEALYTDRP
jgi:hypothetical protein